MQTSKERFINYLYYGGVTKEEYGRVKDQISEENHKVWRLAATAMEVIFLVSFIICATTSSLNQYVLGYIILVAYFMVAAILLFTVITPKSRFFKPLIYLSCYLLVAVILYQGFFAGQAINERNVASYCAIIIAISILNFDRPYRFCILTLLSTIAFILLMFLGPLKSLPLYPDLYVGLVFPIIGVFVTIYINHIRVKDIVLRYNAEQERDIDSLTGVKNKNAYNRMVNTLMTAAKKADLPFALVIFDVNGLKMTNDTYGHEYGDQLLIRATKLIASMFPNCFLYRIGGDEFATFVTGEDFEKRNAIIGEFKKQIATIHDESIILKDDTSIACGYATFDPDIDRDYVSLFSRADASMYENKHDIKSTNKFLVK